MKFNKAKILEEIKPKKHQVDYIKKETNIFLKDINKKLKNAKAVVGGSFEKNTWIAGNYDVDIFVKFNYQKYHEKDISNELEKALKGVRKTKVHGSRDYYQIRHEKFNFEIVPVLDVKNYRQALNVTDVSPLHSKFVKENSNLKLQDEIRLAKQFLKANDLYGAESYIRGVSGYLIELLIIHYKGFDNFVKNVAKWKPNEIIDMKKHYKDKKDLMLSLNSSKVGSLIMIDPVQKNRNVAAALSNEKYELLIKKCQEYFKNPSEKYFEIKKFDLSKYKDYIVLEINPNEGKIDIVGSKLFKLFEFIKSEIEKNGFELINNGWYFDKKSYMWFKVRNNEIDKIRKHYGPFIDDKKNLENFKKKWKGYKIYNEKNKSYILTERKFYKINDLINNYIKNKQVNQYCKSIKIV